MPIRKDLRHFYIGKEYEETRSRIMQRAKDRCEQCAKRNHEEVETVSGVLVFSTRERRSFMFWRSFGGASWRDETGAAFPFSAMRDTDSARVIRVVLTMAHLDHNPAHRDDDNLKMLCQWCHLNWDKLHHRETRCNRKDARRPILTEVA
jgi:hypothetical protein